MKELLQRFLSGVILGVGFLTTIAVAMFVYGLVESSSEPPPKPQLLRHRNFTPDVPLTFRPKISIHKPGGYDIHGTLRNDDTDAWKAIKFTVELYNEAGGLVDICAEYFKPTIAAKTERQFILRCPRPGDVVKYPRPKSFKIMIDGAQHVSEWTGT